MVSKDVFRRVMASKPSRSCRYTSTTIFPRNEGLEKLLFTVLDSMQDEHVSLIVGDFNGLAWRQTIFENSHQNSIPGGLPGHKASYLCRVVEPFLVKGLTCAVSSYTQIHMI